MSQNHSQSLNSTKHGSYKNDSLYAWETQLAINLYSTGHTWMDIDSISADSLKRIKQYDVAAGYMAGGLCALIGTGSVTWPV